MTENEIKSPKSHYNLRELSIKCEKIDDSVTDLNTSNERGRRSKSLTSEEDKKRKEAEKLQKEEERKQREKEKEQERLRKELGKKLKEEEKKRKEEERKLKELEKEEERKRKEAEKEEEKRKKEDERKKKEEERKQRLEEKRLKELEKEEEKKKKDEEKRLKDIEREEERKKKEEERIRKENEKKKEEEEKQRNLDKQRAILKGFLKVDTDTSMNDDNESCNDSIMEIGDFKPLEIKKDMKLHNVERISKKDYLKLTDSNESEQNIISWFEKRKFIESDNTWPEEQNDVIYTGSCVRNHLHTKFLMFSENIRPSYCGTWRKTSEKITPLNPLNEDTNYFDYDYDSDADWECESGEDIGASEDEEEEDIQEEQADLEFLVPHDYLSDGEDCSDIDPEEVDDEGNRITNPKKSSIPKTPQERQRLIEARDKQFEAECAQNVHRIDPNCLGPYFKDRLDCQQFENLLLPFKMICRSTEGYPITCNLQSDFCTDINGGTSTMKSKPVPPEAIPFLIRLIHCNTLSKPKLCYEFRMFWEKHLTGNVPEVSFEDDLQGKDWDEFSIGKKRLVNKIKEIAVKIDGKWIVKSSVINEYQICCVSDNPENPCLEKWEYISGVNKIGSISKIQKKIKIQDNSLLIH